MSDMSGFELFSQMMAQKQWSLLPRIIEQMSQQFSGHALGQKLMDMGTTLFRAGEYSQALTCYLQAEPHLVTLPGKININGLICSTYQRLKDLDKAVAFGVIGIQARDQLSQLSRPQKMVVAFSLFGCAPIYGETAILNAKAMPDVYPGWEMWVYHDKTVPSHVLKRLSALNVRLISAEEENVTHMPGTFWRFLALESSECAAVIMRDADSVISGREQVLVQEWISSDQSFHVIRDWYTHTDLMLAGLWGAKNGLLSGIRGWIDQYLSKNAQIHPTHADQFFLSEFVWPRIKHCCLHHSSIYTMSDTSWPDSLPIIDQSDVGHVGACMSISYQSTLTNPYVLSLLENGKVIGSYTMPAGEGFELPLAYHRAIEQGGMQMRILPYSVEIQGGKT